MNQGATGSLTIAHCAQSACSDARFAVETSGDLGLWPARDSPGLPELLEILDVVYGDDAEWRRS